MYYNKTIKRLPRKFKKKHKQLLSSKRYDFLTINQRLWYIMYQTNRDQANKVINEITSR